MSTENPPYSTEQLADWVLNTDEGARLAEMVRQVHPSGWFICYSETQERVICATKQNLEPGVLGSHRFLWVDADNPKPAPLYYLNFYPERVKQFETRAAAEEDALLCKPMLLLSAAVTLDGEMVTFEDLHA